MTGGGGGRCCGSSPGRDRGSHSANFCPTSGWKRTFNRSICDRRRYGAVVDLGSTLDKVGHGAGQSCVRIVPAERLPFLCEVCDIMLSWIRPVAVLTSQFFLSDENGEVDMPSRRNGSHASLRQEVDFDSLYICPQKTGHALTAGPAVD